MYSLTKDGKLKKGKIARKIEAAIKAARKNYDSPKRPKK